MQQVNVRFHNVDQIRQFINIIDKIDANFDLGSGHRIVDAKSILGVLALDLSGPLRLRYHSNEAGIEEKIAPFLC
ncbi:MAG: HPr family phosphocarrier protein [Acetatifactor sp.]|nr:HPr family phosphocarrier protein [Acetatifactor sp.]